MIQPPYQLVEHPHPPVIAGDAVTLAAAAWQFHVAMQAYCPTPVRNLPGLAGALGIGSLAVKDESSRFGLKAFKGLGASFAMHHWIVTHADVSTDAVFTTATDGNHGRAVAWMARQLGVRSVIYMPAHSVPARVDAIVREGAKVVLVAEGYDAAVGRAMRDASANNWIVIQDTATQEYRDVPRWIAAGYWTMARELEPLLHPETAPAIDVVIVHAGVGTWPAAMVEYYWQRYRERRPRIVVVEPIEAACILESVRAGRPSSATGSQQTMMAGLNCGYPSLAALETLESSVDAFIAIPDEWAAKAMCQLATPTANDPLIIAGESGAASVAGLLALMTDARYAAACRHLGLGAGTRVLTWSTEGATDPDQWARVVGRPVPA